MRLGLPEPGRRGAGADGLRGGTRAVEDAGADAVAAAIRGALAPFTDAAGAVAMHNVFRWVLATKEEDVVTHA